jgi:dienelactone hydrolase
MATEIEGGSTPYLTPECFLLNVAPSILAQIPMERNAGEAYRGPRLIKTELFAQVIQDEWKRECYPNGVNEKISSLGRPLINADEGGVNYHGHVVYPPNFQCEERLPALVIFQTGAGPHDLYFRWKADAWAKGIHNGKETKEKRCIVFIADLLSDDRGWGWDNDKSHYHSLRTVLLEMKNGVRENLRRKVSLAVRTVQKLQGVDDANLAAFCFCLSGHVMMELARARLPGIQCVAAFHGVYDELKRTELEVTNGHPLQVLVCQGGADPYVEATDMQYIKDQLSMLTNVKWNVNEFPGVIHGFTNPSHAHHPNKACFDYSPEETRQSMRDALGMFVATCFVRHPHPTY